MDDCIFCKIVAGDIPAEVVHETDHVLAFRDIHPQAPTHIQIIPKDHVARMSEIDGDRDASWLVDMFVAARAIAEAEGLEAGFRMVFNNGALAGQSVAHVHLHILGGRQLAWPPG